jgi:hypothetical protein
LTPEAVTGGLKVVTNESKVVTDGSKVVTDESEVVTNESEVITDRSKVITNGSKVVTRGLFLPENEKNGEKSGNLPIGDRTVLYYSAFLSYYGKS